MDKLRLYKNAKVLMMIAGIIFLLSPLIIYILFLIPSFVKYVGTESDWFNVMSNYLGYFIVISLALLTIYINYDIYAKRTESNKKTQLAYIKEKLSEVIYSNKSYLQEYLGVNYKIRLNELMKSGVYITFPDEYKTIIEELSAELLKSELCLSQFNYYIDKYLLVKKYEITIDFFIQFLEKNTSILPGGKKIHINNIEAFREIIKAGKIDQIEEVMEHIKNFKDSFNKYVNIRNRINKLLIA